MVQRSVLQNSAQMYQYQADLFQRFWRTGLGAGSLK
jgi:hypothetical protein